MGRTVRLTLIAVSAVLSLGLISDIPAPQFMTVGEEYFNETLVPTNQLLNPAGRRLRFSGRPVDIAMSPRGNDLAVLMPNSVRIYSNNRRNSPPVRTLQASFMGLAFTPDGKSVVASQIGANGRQFIAIVDVKGVLPVEYIELARNCLPAGLVFDPAGEYLYVALNRENSIARVDFARRQMVGTVDIGMAPLGVAITPKGDRLFVSNWGGRRPGPHEATAMSAGNPILVDADGIAGSGTVSVIDVESFSVISEISAGLHPGGIQVSPNGSLAAVANANSDSVTFIDTASLEVVDTVQIPAYPSGYLGSSPTSLAFSPTGQRVYVTCGGNNAVAVLSMDSDETRYRLTSSVPVDWYPVAVAVWPSGAKGETVYVANGKGLGSRDSRVGFNIFQTLGSINIFQGGTVDQSLSDAVLASNDPFRNAVVREAPMDLGQLGIEHVFLIIKENRTYDQVLGDLGRGNGSPSFTTYGWPVTPNQHELAQQFVTLDNFYTSGAVSADGHQWITQAMATDYIERAHASYTRSYPFWGEDPMAYAPTGFIWSNAKRGGRSVRIYGEFTQPASGHSRNWIEYYNDIRLPRVYYPLRSKTPVASMNGLIEPDFPSYAMNIPDIYRAKVFLEKFKDFEEDGSLPNLVIMLLPANHTAGVTPNYPTPSAMVADNDLALGQIIEAVTKSSYWSRSAIFVTEDDAQNGGDHVDGHRTLCFVVSPYTKRGAVDSTHYNQTSVLRTIEEILGLPPMNKFDASALPMRSVFTTTPDLTPFTSLPARIRLDQMNPGVNSLQGPERQAALESLAMDFSRPDAAPEEILNRILWHSAKGWQAAYPLVRHSSNCPKEDE